MTVFGNARTSDHVN